MNAMNLLVNLRGKVSNAFADARLNDKLIRSIYLHEIEKDIDDLEESIREMDAVRYYNNKLGGNQ